MNLAVRMSVVAAHSLPVNANMETQKSIANARRARSRELFWALVAIGSVFVVIHMATNMLGTDGWLWTGIALFMVAIVVIFRSNAIYDRAVNTPGDELAVRRLLKG